MRDVRTPNKTAKSNISRATLVRVNTETQRNLVYKYSTWEGVQFRN